MPPLRFKVYDVDPDSTRSWMRVYDINGATSFKALFTYDHITNANVSPFFSLFKVLWKLAREDLENGPTFALLVVEEVDNWLRQSINSRMLINAIAYWCT
ncbi:hypothetical protein LshimejAT787_1104050 [Lyophyllum shimeji]|uniref:Uncharacterized protein n=1 Tax=Lyophyllum shimeji TaxID=47721 RepID=A0A9P3PT84_LYOSH|nr:hypothetical protein LshimejAT787_1104050 [Lyophyllum shimeji]